MTERPDLWEQDAERGYCFKAAQVVVNFAAGLTAPGSPGERGIPGPLIRTLSKITGLLFPLRPIQPFL